MSVETESIDKLFLELSQFTKAKTNKELVLESRLDSIRQQLADTQRKLVDAQDAVLIGTAILTEIISADEAALTELSDMQIPVPEPALTAKARHAIAQMLKAIDAALTEHKENRG